MCELFLEAIASARAGMMELSAEQETHPDLDIKQALGRLVGPAITTTYQVGVEADHVSFTFMRAMSEEEHPLTLAEEPVREQFRTKWSTLRD